MHRGLQYRPDIEGLRAVAILLVVAAHAHVPGLAGGFIGVDVFFVLSGYLISSLLNQELSATGRIDFMAFYARRLRRLAPALITVVVVTCLVAAAAVSPVELRNQLASAGAALAWVSNIYFTFAGQGYFDTSSETNLFLHTWSLGVEEQFYLVWPALIWLAGSRRTVALVAVLAVSLTASIYLSFESPNFAFYMMPTRAWQFALGALMVSRRLPTGFGPVGFAMIATSAIVFDEFTPYPGWAALLPSAGTAFILASAGPIGSILSIRPLQAIGKLSYSWYLWHWPALLLGAKLLPDSPWRSTALVLASLALAAATYFLVEKPIRKSGPLIEPSRRFVLACSALMLVASGSAYAWLRNLPLPPTLNQQLALPDVYLRGCDTYYRDAELIPCTFGPDDATRTAVLIGDSIAAQWTPALQDHFSRDGWKLVVLTKSSCPMVEAPVALPRFRREFTECQEWRAKALDYINTLHAELIVAGSSHRYPFSEEQWRGGTKAVFKRLTMASPRVIMLASTPEATFKGSDCFGTEDSKNCSGPERMSNRREVRTWAGEAATSAGARVVEISDAVCPGGLCQAKLDKTSVFRDEQHITVAFARYQAQTLLHRIGMTSTQRQP